jgi:hypothetical protein
MGNDLSCRTGRLAGLYESALPTLNTPVSQTMSVHSLTNELIREFPLRSRSFPFLAGEHRAVLKSKCGQNPSEGWVAKQSGRSGSLHCFIMYKSSRW